ncbi:nitroreductase family protein [Ophiocordyceps camponoti-floridani]|uniref:Nitroreductase family protein n=1 Tax=Ophiocordyceps camponoti-floridani TaxID=2030778 RepID=A0A8H4Q2L6_9HYPO|nr:nitroreductase family protein [Ophiocordyceps camponoti-floridani]
MATQKISSDLLLQLARNRRTVYQLNKTLSIPTSRIRNLVQETTLHTPSSFNSQTTRAVLLLGKAHDRLWALTSDTLRAVVPADRWPASEQRLAGFAAAAGTVLFFVDEAAVAKMQEKLPTYADRFPGWAEQSAGMQQWALWTALEADGLGANLQHYNPLIDERVGAEWGLSGEWRLNAQLVFGGEG